ncbi:MAG: hypothetical protein ACJ8GK_02750 [Luteimonas sp.]
MDPTTMLRTAACLFALTALGGLLMAGIRFFGGRNPPAWVAMAHGLLAGAGVTLLAYAAVSASVPRLAVISLVLFLLAALGGLVLNLRYEWNRLLLPASLVIGHAVVAVLAFGLLLAAAWG